MTVTQLPDGRWVAACADCREVESRATEAKARDWAELHRAFIHTAGGCTSCAHPGRITRAQ